MNHYQNKKPHCLLPPNLNAIQGSRCATLLVTCLLFLMLSSPLLGASSYKIFTPSPEKFEKFEIGIHLHLPTNDAIQRYFGTNPTPGVQINPYNPDAVTSNGIDVRVEFKSPSGVIHKVNGFYINDVVRKYTQSGDPNGYTIAEDNYPFRLRFSPDVPGKWTFSIFIDAAAFPSELLKGSMIIKDSDTPGFLKFSDNDRTLEFSNGRPFFPIGENLAWGLRPDIGAVYNQTSHTIMHEQIEELDDVGGNFFRTWLLRNQLHPEWEKLNDYSARSWRMFEVDEILEMAHDRDMYVLLCIQNTAGMGHCYTEPAYIWANNPYNTIPGVVNPEDFFSNSQSNMYQKHKERYMVARWGYSTNLFAWELWNEAEHITDNSDPNCSVAANQTIVENWMVDHTNYFRSLDKNHPVSCSFVNDPWLPTVSALDFITYHRYPTTKSRNYKRNTKLRDMINTHQKPTHYGEMGAQHSGCIDGSTPTSLHNALWASCMANGFSSGLNWWWKESLHNTGYISEFIPLVDFFKRINIRKLTESDDYRDGYDMQNGTGTGYPEMEAFWRFNPSLRHGIGWAHNASYYSGRLINAATTSCNDIPPLDDPNAAYLNFNFSPTQTFEMEGFIPNTDYRFDWYFTDREEGYFRYDIVSTDANGDMTVTPPPMSAGHPDHAFIFHQVGCQSSGVNVQNGWYKIWQDFAGSDLGAYSQYTIGDFDGDEAEEILAGPSSITATGALAQFDYDGVDWQPGWSNINNPNHVIYPYRTQLIPGDFDNDGKDELFGLGANGIWSTLFDFENQDWQWTWSTYGQTTSPIHDYRFELHAGDFDGNGQTDLIGFDQVQEIKLFTFDGGTFSDFWPQGGGSSSGSPIDGIFGSQSRIEILDIDDDGKDELIHFGPMVAEVFDFDNGSWALKWDNNTSPNSFAGWNYPLFNRNDHILSGDLHQDFLGDDLLFIENGPGYSGWATTFDWGNNQVNWRWSNYANPNTIGDWEVANGSTSDYWLVKAEKGQPAFLLARKKCIKYRFLSMYGTTDQFPQKQASGQTPAVIDLEPEWTVFPNPSKGLFHLEIPQLHGEVLIEVFNASGMLVSSQTTGKTTTSLNLKGQVAGLYFIAVTSNDRREVKRVVLIKD